MITEQQKKDRHKYLGSSDLPSILGFSKWATAYDTWLLKRGRIPYQEEVPTPAQEAGNMLEVSVLDWAMSKDYISGPIERDPEIIISEAEWGFPYVDHSDGMEVASQKGFKYNPIEVKTEGLFGPVRMPWGDAGTTEVPEYTHIQCQGHLMATGADICHVPTFLGGRGFGYFYVERDEKLITLIKEAALKFWHEYVLKDTPPPESIPSLDVIKKIRRVEGKPVELEDVLIDRWLSAKEIAKETAQIVIDFQAKILAALDGHQEGIFDEGRQLITNYEQSRKGFDYKKLKAEQPDVAAPYITKTTHRVMRLKKVKQV